MGSKGSIFSNSTILFHTRLQRKIESNIQNFSCKIVSKRLLHLIFLQIASIMHPFFTKLREKTCIQSFVHDSLTATSSNESFLQDIPAKLLKKCFLRSTCKFPNNNTSICNRSQTCKTCCFTARAGEEVHFD